MILNSDAVDITKSDNFSRGGAQKHSEKRKEEVVPIMRPGAKSLDPQDVNYFHGCQ